MELEQGTAYNDRSPYTPGLRTRSIPTVEAAQVLKMFLGFMSMRPHGPAPTRPKKAAGIFARASRQKKAARDPLQVLKNHWWTTDVCFDRICSA